MSNHQVPTIVKMQQDIILDVGSIGFGRQQVARYGIVAMITKRIADNTGKFAGDQNSQVAPVSWILAAKRSGVCISYSGPW